MSVLDAETFHSVCQVIAAALTIGASAISVLVFGLLFNGERAGALIAEIRGFIKPE
jgi:hypothetical protein